MAVFVSRNESSDRLLVEKYGYCDVCAEDLISYVSVVLKNKAVIKTPKNTGVEWLWPLSPNPPQDTDGGREGSGRGWLRELQGRWPGLLG